jgi:hypothetical protein
MVVRSIVTYAATVWWPRVKFRTSRDELRKLQKMAWLGITGAMRTAPTAAIEVLLGLPHLHLQLEAEARAGIYRVSTAVMNGNPNLRALARVHDSGHERRTRPTDGD